MPTMRTFFGRLCIAEALEAAKSDTCSAHRVYNNLRANWPDVLKILIKSTRYFHRQGEVSNGEDQASNKRFLPRARGWGGQRRLDTGLCM